MAAVQRSEWSPQLTRAVERLDPTLPKLRHADAVPAQELAEYAWQLACCGEFEECDRPYVNVAGLVRQMRRHMRRVRAGGKTWWVWDERIADQVPACSAERWKAAKARSFPGVNLPDWSDDLVRAMADQYPHLLRMDEDRLWVVNDKDGEDLVLMWQLEVFLTAMDDATMELVDLRRYARDLFASKFQPVRWGRRLWHVHVYDGYDYQLPIGQADAHGALARNAWSDDLLRLVARERPELLRLWPCDMYAVHESDWEQWCAHYKIDHGEADTHYARVGDWRLPTAL